MSQIQLDERLYQEAQRRAFAAGFESVDAYVADVLQQDLGDAENLDRLFTPERLALVDRSAALLAAGQGLTAEQAEAALAKRRDEWLRKDG